MAESKHTPGGWRVSGEISARFLNGIGDVVLVRRDGDGDDRYVAIACLDGMGGEGPSTSSEERNANARLIAAAPDLLDALHLMTSAFKAFRMKPVGAPGSAVRDEQDQQIAAENAARAAIAAATGSA